GSSEIRDESAKDVRRIYEVKRDANANVVLNNLYKHTALQSSFSVNYIALVAGRPKMINLNDMILVFVEHIQDVVVRYTKFELEEDEKRAHILEGYLIALDHLDEVIKLIRSSDTPEDARLGLMEKFSLSDIQARAILDMTLRRLTGLERDKIKEEYAELMKTIEYLKQVLADETLRYQIIKEELLEVKEKFGDERRSLIVHSAEDMTMEDFIDDEEVVITISHNSYVKRTPLTEYKRQGRGGKGSIGS